MRPDIFGMQGQLTINDARHEIKRLRVACQDAVTFLDRIEGHGYGGEAEFENARRGLRAAGADMSETGWQPIETAKTAPYEKVDVWAHCRKNGKGRRFANAYRTNKHWLDNRGYYIAGKRYRDEEGDDCFDPDATDEESTIVTHWMPLPPPPSEP